MGNMNNWGNMNNFRGNMNNPFGINPKQLLSMLGGNMNMNGLSKILSSMNTEGFDLNSFSNQMGGYNKKNNTFNSEEQSNFTNTNNESRHSSKNEERNNDDLKERIKNKNIDEEDIQFLINLKEIVDQKKKVFIDEIINLLTN